MNDKYTEKIIDAFKERALELFQKHEIGNRTIWVCYKHKWKGMVHEMIGIYRIDDEIGFEADMSSNEYIYYTTCRFICKYGETLLEELNKGMKEEKKEYDEEIRKKQRCAERIRSWKSD